MRSIRVWHRLNVSCGLNQHCVGCRSGWHPDTTAQCLIRWVEELSASCPLIRGPPVVLQNKLRNFGYFVSHVNLVGMRHGFTIIQGKIQLFQSQFQSYCFFFFNHFSVLGNGREDLFSYFLLLKGEDQGQRNEIVLPLFKILWVPGGESKECFAWLIF